ncbi:MAG: hypothetical protein AAF846_26120 [Chloroflexota bacterium]
MEFISLLAQSNDVMAQVNDFFAALQPDGIGDILIYVVFFMALLTTFFLADGNNMAGNLLYVTMVLAIFNVTVGDVWYNDQDVTRAFPAFAARVLMFLLPLIAAGAARSKKKKGKLALPLAAVTGIIGMLYAVGAFLDVF